MAKSAFQVLLEKIDDDVQVVKDSMSRGAFKSYEEYKEGCGLIRGLESARSHITDLSRNFEEYDND